VKIQTIRLQNFRSYKDQTINLGDYNCFVGANGAGKSAVLTALNVFFRNPDVPTNTTVLQREDFHLKDTTKPIEITVTFSDLSAEAMEDFKEYVRHGQLVVTVRATWDEQRQCAEVKQYGSRLVMKQFAPFFKADSEGAKAPELRTMYESLRKEFPELPTAQTKGAMATALRDFEQSHPELCVLVESEDHFYGWSKGANRLARHCQWVYIPAVKNPTDEQQESKNTALGQLLQRTIRSKIDFATPIAELRRELNTKYKELIDREQSVLAEISGSIQARLREWAHPGAKLELQWHYDQEKTVVVNEPFARISIGEGPFIGELARLGHGLQRSFIVTLLHELAMTGASGQPTLILGFEEPELYQHPPQARHLATVLEKLSTEGCQILITTHSPYFVSGRGFESIRFVRKAYPNGSTEVKSLTHEKLAESLAMALGEDPPPATSIMAVVEQIMQPSQNELFFSRVPILVEGVEDIAYVSTYLQMLGKWTEFRRYGCHFIVCGGKGQMSRPLAIAIGLGIPAFVIFDGDTNAKDKGQRDANRRDNGCILSLCGHTGADPLSESNYWSGDLVMWSTNIGAVVRADVGEDYWESAEKRVRAEFSLTHGVNRKNALLIAATLEKLWGEGIRSLQLERLCTTILEHAARVHGPIVEESPLPV
jgi:hypothetical protein